MLARAALCAPSFRPHLDVGTSFVPELDRESDRCSASPLTASAKKSKSFIFFDRESKGQSGPVRGQVLELTNGGSRRVLLNESGGPYEAKNTYPGSALGEKIEPVIAMGGLIFIFCEGHLQVSPNLAYQSRWKRWGASLGAATKSSKIDFLPASRPSFGTAPYFRRRQLDLGHAKAPFEELPRVGWQRICATRLQRARRRTILA